MRPPLICATLTPAPTAPPTFNFGVADIFSNRSTDALSQVKNAAHQQVLPNSHPFYKSNGVETRVYGGDFVPNADTTKLAVLSDDGTSVWINGQQVLGRAGQGQGFEHFERTFTPLSYDFVAGQTYCSNWVVSQGWERGLRTLPNTDRNSFGSGRKPRRSPYHTTQLEQ